MSKAQLCMDARMVGPRPHGIGRYTVSLARALRRTCPEWRPVLLVSEDAPADLLDEFAFARSPVGFLDPREVVALPAAVSQLGVRLHHATSFSCSPLMTVPQVITLHDAIHLQRPQDYGLKQAVYYRTVVTAAALRAPAIITVSADAREQVAAHLPIPLSRITVVHNGVDPSFGSVVTTPRVDGTVFTITGPKPHKNTQVLVHALRHAPSLQLRVAGQPADGLEEMARGLGLQDRVTWLGPLEDAALKAELARCAVFALPSTLEGFGLPALEAMAAGSATVLSDIPVFREVGGDAAAYVPPLDAVAWASALARLSTHAAERSALETAGPIRAAAFTWEACARATGAVYERAVSASRLP